MADEAAFRERARATWAAGNWDGISRRLTPVGDAALERAAVASGMDLLDVGTGTGGTVAIPAAQLGARVVGADITPELLVQARQRAADAGVAVEWVEADAQALPFADASFDRVLSTFGAMFAPDHRRAAAELIRVCRSGGLVVMTTWASDGFAGELFNVAGSFLPPPPPGVGAPPQWGVESHITDTFAAAGAHPEIERRTLVFTFPSVADMVREYGNDFGPFVMARGVLEPQGRWPEFLDAFTRLVERFDEGGEGEARIGADYLLITVQR
jgi:SAM-dependent methyltransferase